MAEIGKRSSVAVSWTGKVKTFSQMFALWVLIWRYDDWMVWIGYASLYVATILTIYSMMQYLMAAKDDLLESD
ncbi:CDP-diacylglycerol-glycerol-3-phosphate 3-phosphatidyltransferase [Vibrio sp. JCM 19236]|nr:CDP-diacylglycerol-glycerol-3-phosphate 3-phosphatidyltransferase [Vibrio sp. JCM 19236]